MNKVTLTLTLNLHRNMAAMGLVSFSLSLLTLDLNIWSTVAFSRAFFIGRSISHQQGYFMRTARSFSSCNEVHAKPLLWETVEDCDETSLTHRIMNRSDRNENSVFKVSALAKLAVAFSPLERRITLSDINAVNLLKIDGDRIEIEAVVCDDDSCVSLFIPVDFPNSCRGLMDGSQEQCIIENMELLQNVAEGRIIKLQQGLESEKLELGCPEWHLEVRRPTMQEVAERFPPWWIVTEHSDVQWDSKKSLIDESDLIKNLLNSGDFDDEINRLASDGLTYLDNGDLYVIEKAVVADVGPAGFCLRARALLKSESDSLIEEKEKRRSIVELCWPFDGNPATDPTTLRSKVLGAIAAVSGATSV